MCIFKKVRFLNEIITSIATEGVLFIHFMGRSYRNINQNN
jgi:hypothetical protein